MNLSEYSRHDGLGLTDLVTSHQVSPQELADAAAAAIAAVNPRINAVIETYEDRLANVDGRVLGSGPFHGGPVPDQGRWRAREGPQDRVLLASVRGHGVRDGLQLKRPPPAQGRCQHSSAGRTRPNTRWRPRRRTCSTATRIRTVEASGIRPAGRRVASASAVAAGIVPIAHGSDISRIDPASPLAGAAVSG